MFKSIGVAGAFGAFGLPVLAVVGIAAGCVGIGVGVGYAVWGIKGAVTVAGVAAAA